MATPLLAAATLVAITAGGPPRADSATWAGRTLATLSLREKLAQMVMPWIPGGNLAERSADWRRARQLVLEEKVGGLIVGAGPAPGTAAQLNELQRLSDLPLLVAADLEWGAGTRLDGATVLPVNMAVAAAGTPWLAHEAGRITAVEARAAGIHMAFAPVADVNVNPENPVINTRSYGADPLGVAERVGAFIAGARAAGLLTVAKHFPGHGDTELDSHLTLPTVLVSRNRLRDVELLPFRAAIAAGVDGIMTAHLAVPALEPEGIRRPATLSPAILSALLRDELGFDGLIVTDALIMDGVRRDREVGEVAVAAVRAGADILLMPPDADDAIDALAVAVRGGELSEARIDASVRRILRAKETVGLDRDRTVDLVALLAVLSSEEHKSWAQDVAERSITLVRNGEGGLPFALDGKRVVSIAYDNARRHDEGEAFNRALAELGAEVEFFRLWRRSSNTELRQVERAAARADVVVFSTYARATPWRGTLGLPSRVAEMAQGLAADGAVIISFGDPYLLGQLSRADTYLIGWSDADIAQRAAARAISGGIAISGRLPIPLPPYHALGEGIHAPQALGSPVAPEGGDANPTRN